MAVTLKDVAELAGVSRSAVSRAFTEGASVSAKTRSKVEEAAAALGYSPNFLARSLTTRRTKLIGLVTDNFTNPFFLKAFGLLTDQLQKHDLRPLLVNISGERDPENVTQMLKQYSVDGVIVASSTVGHEFAETFRESNIPVTYVFTRYSETPSVNVVGIDNVHAGRLAARVLIERGYRRLGFLGGPEESFSTQDRFSGFRAEILGHADVSLTHDFAEDYSFEAGREAMEWMLETEIAEAYFGADDVLSIGAMAALRAKGLRVPEDVGMIGLNDMEMAGWDTISLTTIGQPMSKIIAATVEMMAALLDNPGGGPRSKLFPCRLIERKTLRPV